MKVHNLIAILGVLALPISGFADVLVQTSDNEWSVSRNITVTGDSQTSGSASLGALGNIDVSRYVGAQDLSRVVIKILQPNPDVAATIAATLSIASGSTTFSSATSNRLTESTTVNGFDSSIYSALEALGASIDDYARNKVSASYANVTLTNPDTLSRTIDITQAPVTVFDSADFSSLSSADLNTIFRDGADINFGYGINSSLSYARNSTGVISATLTGFNTGQIVIEYYAAVPEPSTYALVGLGLGAVLFFRRRLKVRA